MKNSALVILLTIMTAGPAFADGNKGVTMSLTGGANSNDKNKNVPLPWTEISVGTSTFTQTLDNTHLEHPMGFHASVHSRFGGVHFGLGALGVYHNEQQAAGTYSQVNIAESLTMEALEAGVILGNFIVINGGYGFAQFRRSVSDPYAAPSTTTNVTANGMGWELGGTLVPFRTKTTSFGLTYYYFDATSTAYTTDSDTGVAHTNTSTPGKVHASGSFAGVAILLNY
jgi:hypothetical protein